MQCVFLQIFFIINFLFWVALDKSYKAKATNVGIYCKEIPVITFVLFLVAVLALEHHGVPVDQ